MFCWKQKVDTEGVVISLAYIDWPGGIDMVNTCKLPW